MAAGRIRKENEMLIYDEVLGKEENVHEFVEPDVGREIELDDPDVFEKLFDPEVEEDE